MVEHRPSLFAAACLLDAIGRITSAVRRRIGSLSALGGITRNQSLAPIPTKVFF
jgi:hypothetical protein